MKRKASEAEEDEEEKVIVSIEEKVPVLIFGIHEDTQSYPVAGSLTRKELTVLRTLANSGPHERQKIVTETPTSLAALVLKKIYKYEQEEEDCPFYELSDETGEGGDFVNITHQMAGENLYYTIVWSLIC